MCNCAVLSFVMREGVVDKNIINGSAGHVDKVERFE
jgi:hypothetical protein